MSRGPHVTLQLVRTCKAYSYVTNGTEFWSITVVLADLLSVKCFSIMDSIIRNMSIHRCSRIMKFVERTRYNRRHVAVRQICKFLYFGTFVFLAGENWFRIYFSFNARITIFANRYCIFFLPERVVVKLLSFGFLLENLPVLSKRKEMDGCTKPL